MYLFRKKTLLSVKAFSNFIDYHSHLLPGVDDGIRTMEESLRTLRCFEELGFVKVWCTPHIMDDIPNTTAALRSRFAELKAAYDGPIELRLSSENMLDCLFEERLETGDVLPFGDSADQLLVETSYFNPPSNMKALLGNIFSKGFFPVLAHPERYRYMSENDYKELVDKGVRLQLNVLSLGGCYGKVAQQKAEWLLKHDLYSYRGTDIHGLDMFQARIGNRINKY